MSKNSVVFELYGKVNLINVSKLLLPGVSLSIRLNLENPDFFIKEAKFTNNTVETKTDSILKIDSAKLYVRHTVPSTDIILAHERLLSAGRSAIYEYKRGEIYTQTIAAGTNNLNVLNLYQGPKPSLIVFGMVSNEAYSGSRMKDPFLFTSQNLKSFNFVINGSSRPVNPYDIQMDDSHSCYNHVFSKVFESLGYHNTDHSNLVTRENFKNHFLILEDLSNFNISLSDINEPSENVNIGVSGTFSKTLKETITCVLYLLIPSRFEVSGNRRVTLVL